MNDTLTLTLPARQMDIIANALAQRPYIEVVELLNNIAQQIKAQQEQPSIGPVMPEQAALANGGLQQ